MVKRRLAVLAFALLVASAAFLGWGLKGPIAFILELRSVKLAALICVGAATGCATILFQTATMNRLLTPNIVGFDALFVLFQTLIVASLGALNVAQINDGTRFFGEAAVLMVAATLLFGGLLRSSASDLMRVVLTGVILGVLLRGLSTLVQRMMDPSEYAVVQQASFASFGSVNTSQLFPASICLCICFIVVFKISAHLDVAALGRDGARGVGLNYDKLVLISLLIVSALISVSTALVGPITFLGLLAASLARFFLDSFSHRVLIPGAAIIGALILVIGQFVFERLLSLESTLSVVVEFCGGIVFLLLVLRKGQR